MRTARSRKWSCGTILTLVVSLGLLAPVAAQACTGVDCVPPVLSDTGDKPAPTSVYEATMLDPADPADIAAKEAALAANFAEDLAAVDIPGVDPGLELRGSYDHKMNVPYYLQERSYWCGPATTRQILGAIVSTPASQTSLASDLGTDTNGTYFPLIAKVLNNRKPDQPGGPWIKADIVHQGDLIARMDYNAMNNIAGALHIKLLTAFFSYYNYDHDGHIMASAGVRKNKAGIYHGYYTDPYNEGSYRSGGASTGGQKENRIHNLFNATRANAGDMIY
jgi:peptidase C39-like protein